MTERILEIIKHLHLSPSDFAEEIGVQRSSISHLISGRNKPSLEFIQKILTRYPEISTEWLLSGKGEMLNREIQQIMEELPFENEAITNDEPKGSEKEVQKIKDEPQKREIQRIAKKKVIETDDKVVEKIIYLYKDKTFREYYPE